MARIQYHLFCIKWLWNNRTWQPSRQKYKAMEKAWKEHEANKY